MVELQPDYDASFALGLRAMIVTARAEPGEDHDIVSRVFGPNVGIPEDPATGSAHCALVPTGLPFSTKATSLASRPPPEAAPCACTSEATASGSPPSLDLL